MDDILDLLIQTPGPRGRTGLPAIFLGPPGVAKTSVLENAGRRHGLFNRIFILGLRDPTDVAGLPIPDSTGKTPSVSLAPPRIVVELLEACENGKGAIVIFDEYTQATPVVQGCSMRIIAEGWWGDIKLPDTLRMFMAANPPDCAAGGNDLTAPSANRMLHFDWQMPTAEDWAEWLVGGCTHVDKPIRHLTPEAWQKAWAHVVPAYASAIKKLPHLIHKMPETDAQRGEAWPSHRSNELAVRALVGAHALGMSDGRKVTVLGAAIGEGPAAEIWRYLQDLDLPDVEDVLAGRASVPVDRGDKAFASLTAVVLTVMNDAPDNERRVIALEIANAVAQKHADIAVAVIRPLAATLGMPGSSLLRKYGTRVDKAMRGPLEKVAHIYAAAEKRLANPGKK